MGSKVVEVQTGIPSCCVCLEASVFSAENDQYCTVVSLKLLSDYIKHLKRAAMWLWVCLPVSSPAHPEFIFFILLSFGKSTSIPSFQTCIMNINVLYQFLLYWRRWVYTNTEEMRWSSHWLQVWLRSCPAPSSVSPPPPPLCGRHQCSACQVGVNGPTRHHLWSFCWKVTERCQVQFVLTNSGAC